MTSEYLGDSVYIKFDGSQVKLFTDNGSGPENEIYMEPEVVYAFQAWLAKLTQTKPILQKP